MVFIWQGVKSNRVSERTRRGWKGRKRRTEIGILCSRVLLYIWTDYNLSAELITPEMWICFSYLHHCCRRCRCRCLAFVLILPFSQNSLHNRFFVVCFNELFFFSFGFFSYIITFFCFFGFCASSHRRDQQNHRGTAFPTKLCHKRV